MSRISIIILLLCSVSLIAYGCATTDVQGKAGSTVYQTVKIKSSGSYEECMEVYPGQVMDYSFDASDFVNFNIHYHTEEEVKYPVNRNGIMFGKGSINVDELEYYTKEQEFFCLMWDNLNSENVKVAFSCKVSEKKQNE